MQRLREFSAIVRAVICKNVGQSRIIVEARHSNFKLYLSACIAGRENLLLLNLRFSVMQQKGSGIMFCYVYINVYLLQPST